jgi:Zn-dependent protease
LIIEILGLMETDTTLFLVLLGAVVFALLVGIGFHEACHAFMATALGDTLPARQGRATLNPLAHLDPAGTVMMLLIGFGWGKPVEFNPFGLRVSPKSAMLLVSLAGPLSNFVAAGLLGIPLKMGWAPYINPFDVVDSEFLQATVTTREDYIGVFLTGAVFLNCILGVFNLVPIHPLDGFKVVVGLLPDGPSQEFAKLAKYGPVALMLIIFLPFITGGQLSPLSDIMVPAVSWLVEAFTGGP